MRRIVLLLMALNVLAFFPYQGAQSGEKDFKERIHLNVGAGWGNYDMKRAMIRLVPYDEYIYDEYRFKRIEGGREYYGETIFDYSRNISFGCGILYSSGSTNLSEWFRDFMDDYYSPGRYPNLYEASLVAPYLKASYGSAIDVIDYSINGNLYYGFGSLYTNLVTNILQLEIQDFTFKSEGIGYSFSIGFSFVLTGGFSIENVFGYRNLVTGKLKDSGGNELENSNLNFNGYFIRGGISVNPWGK